MDYKRSVKLQPVYHRSAERLLVRFWYNAELVQLVRSMGGRYSATHSCWHVAFSEENIKYIREQLVEYGVILLKREQERPEARSKKEGRLAHGAAAYIGRLNDEQKEEIIQFEQYMRVQRYSNNTVKAYLAFVRSFLGFCKNKPSAYIMLSDVHKYNYEVIIKNRYSISYQRQFIGAVKLFFNNVVYCYFNTEELERPVKERKLPVVLSKEEVRQVLVCTRNIKHKAILTTIYGAGLRVGELLNLRIGDVDPNRLQIHVKGGKGKKDRYVKMSKANLLVVQRYLNRFTPYRYLFEGPGRARYSASSVRNILKVACERAGIRKRVTPHTLRHSYATHLLELGVDLRYVQSFLGHKKPETTMIYTHISSEKVSNLVNPLDELFKEELVFLADKRNTFATEPALIPQNDWGY
jgi:site-specific recombinase XerD